MSRHVLQRFECVKFHHIIERGAQSTRAWSCGLPHCSSLLMSLLLRALWLVGQCSEVRCGAVHCQGATPLKRDRAPQTGPRASHCPYNARGPYAYKWREMRGGGDPKLQANPRRRVRLGCANSWRTPACSNRPCLCLCRVRRAVRLFAR